jgi:hypothetical protein
MLMSTTIDTMQRFLQDVLGFGYVVDWPPNNLVEDSVHIDFDIIEATTYFFICMIRVENNKIIILDHKYKTDEFEYSDPRYDPNHLLIKIKSIRDRNYVVNKILGG